MVVCYVKLLSLRVFLMIMKCSLCGEIGVVPDGATEAHCLGCRELAVDHGQGVRVGFFTGLVVFVSSFFVGLTLMGALWAFLQF